MKTLLAAVVLVSSSAFAQFSIRIGIPVPVVRVAVPVVQVVPVVPVVEVPVIQFAAPPPVVEIEPGISVVAGIDEEVVFSEGFYWHQREGHWFRSRDHRGNWEAVEAHHVPARIASRPVGHFRAQHAQMQRSHAPAQRTQAPVQRAPMQRAQAPAQRTVARAPSAPSHAAPARGHRR